MSEEEYTKITYDYVVAMVSALQSGDVGKAHGDKEPFRFVFISGAGVDPSGQTSKTLYGRVKGRAERFLLDLPADSNIRACILRPGYFFPTEKEYVLNTRSMTERALSVALKPIMSTFVPTKYTPIEELDRFAVEAAKGSWGNEAVINNMRMKELMRVEGNS